jgi:hypothetical protein
MLAGSRTLHLSAIGFATVEATLFQAAFPDYDVLPKIKKKSRTRTSSRTRTIVGLKKGIKSRGRC